MQIGNKNITQPKQNNFEVKSNLFCCPLKKKKVQ